jgi:hypothetical protein
MFLDLRIAPKHRITICLTRSLWSVGVETIIGQDRGRPVWASI